MNKDNDQQEVEKVDKAIDAASEFAKGIFFQVFSLVKKIVPDKNDAAQ